MEILAFIARNRFLPVKVTPLGIFALAMSFAGTVFAAPSLDLPRIDRLGIGSPVPAPELRQTLPAANLDGRDRAIQASENQNGAFSSSPEALPAEAESFAQELLGQQQNDVATLDNEETQQAEQPAAAGKLPGMSDRALTRFRREMFRTDI